MRRSFIGICTALSLALLAGCSSAPMGLEGEVVAPISSAAIPEQAQFVAGEALVQMKADLSAASTSANGGYTLLRQNSGASGQSVGVTSAAGQDTLEWIAELRRNPQVEWAEPNYRRQALQNPSVQLLAPNDALFYNETPRFAQIGLNSAWSLSTGSSQVTVAVLDDGIFWRQGDSAATHPDLNCGRIVAGYDFVSERNNGDGNGRDSDPYADSGEGHGTHVAGILGACTNNSEGIAGADWNARILPVRVLGANGGNDADIIDGIRWAAGLPVNGTPRNPNPAKIINLSLGGFGLSRSFDTAIEEVTALGVIVVAAAGNDNDDALLYSPAGNNNVITVGATDSSGRKAEFSNYGPSVEVMAPGTAILSTARGSKNARFGYQRFYGTSMAAPYISGVVALMAAVRPNLTWVEAAEYLRKSATSVSGCGGCGAGQINAREAVVQAQRGDAIGGFLSTQRISISKTQQRVVLRNFGDQSLSFNSASTNSLRLEPNNGVIAAGGSLEANLILTPPSAAGIYQSTVALNPDNGPMAVLLGFFQSGNGVRNVGRVQVALCQETPTNTRLVSSQVLEYSGQYRFRFPVSPDGSVYFLRAWVDADNDGRSELSTSRRYTSPAGSVQLLLKQQSLKLSAGGCLAVEE